MKALVLSRHGRLDYTDVPEPELGPADVLIEVKACGICGSDVHGMDGSSGRRLPPIIMGHEAAGTVAQVGEAVSNIDVGDRVTFDSTIYCGLCDFCARGEINLCDFRQVFGVSCAEYRRDGAFAELVSVPARIVYQLPEEVSFEQAALVEPVAIAYHAVRLTPLTPDDTVVVVGTGMIGLLLVQVLRAEGWWKIVAVDIDASRLELAAQFGAELTLQADQCDVSSEVLAFTEGRGADAAFEAVGTNDTVQVSADLLRKGGALTLIGNLAPTVDLPLQTVVTRQLRLQGSCASAGEYPECLHMIARGAVDVDSLISVVAPLSEGAAWFDRLRAGEPGLMKVVLVP